MGLTAKQKKFCDEYLVDLNVTRAYREAYPNCRKDSTAASAGSRLSKKREVQDYIEEKRREAQRRTQITADKVLAEYAKLAFFDPRKLFDEKGKPRELWELDEDTAACIAGLDVSEVYEGRGENRELAGYVKKYKLADRKAALDSIGRHLGLFNDKVTHSGEVEITISDEVREWAE